MPMPMAACVSAATGGLFAGQRVGRDGSRPHEPGRLHLSVSVCPSEETVHGFDNRKNCAGVLAGTVTTYSSFVSTAAAPTGDQAGAVALEAASAL